MGKLRLREVKNVLVPAESGCELFFPKAQTLPCPSALKYVPLVGVTVGCKAEHYPYSR